MKRIILSFLLLPLMSLATTHVYVCGFKFGSKVVIDNDPLAPISYDIFISKYDVNGSKLSVIPGASFAVHDNYTLAAYDINTGRLHVTYANSLKDKAVNDYAWECQRLMEKYPWPA